VEDNMVSAPARCQRGHLSRATAKPSGSAPGAAQAGRAGAV